MMNSFLWLPLMFAPTADTAATLDLFPNYHTVGVNVRLEVNDPEQDATATLEYGTDFDTLRAGFPLSRVVGKFPRLSGCVFWCSPGTKYSIRVRLSDPTTPALEGLVLDGTVSTRAEPSASRPQRTLYVAPDGQGAKYTRAQPGQLGDGLKQAGAGTRIVLLAGRYYVGDLKLTASGTSAAPIVLEGERGKQVVLDGAATTPPVWRAAGSKGLYVTDTSHVNPNLVVADGARLYPHQSLTDLKTHKIAAGIDKTGIVRFDAELDGFYRNPSSNPLVNSDWRRTKRLYIKFRDNSDPADKDIVITSQNRGLTVTGQSHIVLRNLHFAHYGRSPAATALRLTDAEEVVLEQCTFGINDVGILLAGNCRNITIQDCNFFDSMSGWFVWKIKASYDNFAPFSTIFPHYSRMLERGGLTYQHGFRGRGIVVRRNRFHDFAQAGHLGPPSRNDNNPDSYEIDFHNNQVWNCTEDGFELDGDARNVRVWHNVFHHCNAPISLAVAQGGPTYILCNIFHSIAADRFTINPKDGIHIQPGHAFKFQTGDTKSLIGELFFLHNTVDAPEQAVGMELIAPARWKRFFARNNLVVSDKAPALVVSSYEFCPTDLDYNGYFARRAKPWGTVDINTRDKTPRRQIRTITQLHTLGWERHGLYADPRFVDSARNDYRLQATSPAIDRGQVIPGINDRRYRGKGPDLGALELK